MSNELQLGLFRWAAKSVSQRGFIKSVKVAVSMVIDVGFDLRYRTETIKWVDLASLNISPEVKATGIHTRQQRQDLCASYCVLWIYQNMGRSLILVQGKDECY